MEFLFDTANLEDIRRYGEIYPITGVTSNPSIIKAEGRIDFFAHFRKIRALIGSERSLHIQVVSSDAESMLKEADAILAGVDNDVYIKVPVTEDGLKVMRVLKERGVNITATAIYTKIQAILAIQAGADYLAPYFNRMENMSIDPRAVIAEIADLIRMYGYDSKILAASFKNIGQVTDAFSCGAQSATVSPDILHAALQMPAIAQAVDNFHKDWETTFGEGARITDFTA
ncbi:fructose-6-phosphate aldolase [Candidatus Soleaferrea massiliensis]|uniref:fructose-6-phosphate aldolase n=1 Tax=Candidatus Soleaferrea massiliensis TaxID=1470354 RepID=UPI000590A501|nr:fructose-6-phosphate aldolase [Candidatus Soleaferrea massiliensis]